MFKGEAYALHPLGSADEIDAYNGRELYESYLNLVKTSPLDCFVVGDVNPERIVSIIGDALPPLSSRGENVASQPARKLLRQPRTVNDFQKVNQGKLSLGFRTYTTIDDPLFYSMMVMEGILGGFPHSKLFLNVREKEQVCYYAQSSLDSTKGVLLAVAGIDERERSRTTDLILQQLDAIKAGDISGEELTATQRALFDRVRSTEDSAGGMMSVYYERALAGAPADMQARLDGIAGVTRDSVIEAANRLDLDVIYFLGPRGGAR
jgi:predicted Zn-dependent peptidase